MLGNILSCIKGVKDLSRLKREGGIFLETPQQKRASHLSLRGENACFSPVAAGTLVFLFSYDGNLSDPLVFPQESLVSMRVVCGLSGFLYIQFWGLGPHLELKPKPQCSSPVLTWISGFLWSFNRRVRPRCMWRHANPLSSRAVTICQSSSRVDIGTCGFLSRCHRAVTTAIVFGVNTRGDNQVRAGESGVFGVDWDIRVFWNGGTTSGVPLEC